jgi:hypothetical protein
MVTRIKFPKNLKKEVYQAFAKSKKITGIYQIHNSVIYIDKNDFEEAEKIFNRIILNFKFI